MGSVELADELKESKDHSQMRLMNLVPVEIENTVEIPIPEAIATMGPSTPDADDRENSDFPSSDSKSSSTKVKLIKIKPLHLSCFESTDFRSDNVASSACNDQVSSPRTPKDSVFDPFAATPGHIPFAPLLQIFCNDHVVPVTRRLQFDSVTRNTEADQEWVSEEELCEVLTESLLEAVVLKQTESALSELSAHESDTSGCGTPPLAPCISGVAQTCPGAPIKASGKSRNVDLGLCRKLEF